MLTHLKCKNCCRKLQKFLKTFFFEPWGKINIEACIFKLTLIFVSLNLFLINFLFILQGVFFLINNFLLLTNTLKVLYSIIIIIIMISLRPKCNFKALAKSVEFSRHILHWFKILLMTDGLFLWKFASLSVASDWEIWH